MAKSPSRRRQSRGRKALKSLAAVVEANNGDSPTEKKEVSTLLEEHNQARQDEPGVPNSARSAQADSSLLVRHDDQQAKLETERPGSRRTTRLFSSAFRRRQLGHVPKSADSNDRQSVEQRQLPSPRQISTESSFRSIAGRRTSMFGTFGPRIGYSLCGVSASRVNSAASILGSLRGPMTETHLPLLDSDVQAQLQQLSVPGSQALEILIDNSDELPFGAYSRPLVRVHVVDRCTGRALQPPVTTGRGRFAGDHSCISKWLFSTQLSVILGLTCAGASLVQTPSSGTIGFASR